MWPAASSWPASRTAASISAAVIGSPSARTVKSSRTPGPKNHSSGSSSVVFACPTLAVPEQLGREAEQRLDLLRAGGVVVVVDLDAHQLGRSRRARLDRRGQVDDAHAAILTCIHVPCCDATCLDARMTKFGLGTFSRDGGAAFAGLVLDDRVVPLPEGTTVRALLDDWARSLEDLHELAERPPADGHELSE